MHALFALLGCLILSFAGISAANAAPTVGGGDKYNIGTASCTMGAVGWIGDAKVGITAGHCGSVGDVATVNGTRIGVFVSSESLPGLDHAVIQLDAGITIRPSGRTISGPPPKYSTVCKYGHGILNVGERCGVVLGHTANDVCSTVGMIWGDSGGPVYYGNKLYGFTSRLWGASCGVLIFARADVVAARTGFTLY